LPDELIYGNKEAQEMKKEKGKKEIWY
jgi:hypothetical protein